ncbi:MAG: HD-GYP domain-containing protein [Ruminococcus sp.]|nr:HD-GYP domain-containing protein [Ruminococcus sp.]
MPLVYDGETKAVLAINYNWDSFHSQLIEHIWLIAGLMLGAMVICCIILMILVNRIAIKPLSNVQLTVREYMKNKDSDSAQEHLKKIKTHNEIGVLADDVGALVKEITSYTEAIKTLTTEVMEALARTIDAKDKYTNGHSLRVAMYSMMIAQELGMSKQQQLDIYYMGLLHDIGKIGIPNAIINKTTKLTDEEYDMIKKHPILGYEILSQIQSMPDLSIGARYHHERVDGKGYPDGLSGYDIPYTARIIAVADSYDSMTSNRSYRKYLPQEVARSEIANNIGTQFDLAAATAMLSIIDKDVHYQLHE